MSKKVIDAKDTLKFSDVAETKEKKVSTKKKMTQKES